MRKVLTIVVSAVAIAAAGVVLRASPRTNESMKMVKRQQKMARKQLKIEERMWKRSFRGQRIPRAERLAQKHQFQRQMRELRLQQKDQIQEMKDRERLMNYRRSHPY